MNRKRLKQEAAVGVVSWDKTFGYDQTKGMETKLLLLTLFASYLAISNGLSTPPRGWNSWISYKGCINESQVIQNAQAVVKYLKPYGYEYITIDGGWSASANGTQYIDEYGRPRM